MKKVLMLATTAAMIEQFNKNNILILEEMGYEVHVAGNWNEGNPISDERLERFKEWIVEHNGKYFHIPALRKPTAFKRNICAYKKVIELIHENQYEFIHCHTPIGSVIGRLAAHRTNTKIIYTAHGFHFYKGAPLVNWLVYYPVERFLSRWTDILITINQEDYNRAKKSFHAKRTEYVPGIGIDLNRFKPEAGKRDEKRLELGLQTDDVMLLSVGELNENKNHQIIIRALAKLESENVHYVIAGQGKLLEKLMVLAITLGIQKRVHLLGYRDDISELYHAADVFVFPSKREGLSVALMEAMACGLPVICSAIRGNVDLVKDEKGGLLIQTDIEEAYGSAIEKLYINPKLKEAMSLFNLEAVRNYSIEKVMEHMACLYKMVC